VCVYVHHITTRTHNYTYVEYFIVIRFCLYHHRFSVFSVSGPRGRGRSSGGGPVTVVRTDGRPPRVLRSFVGVTVRGTAGRGGRGGRGAVSVTGPWKPTGPSVTARVIERRVRDGRFSRTRIRGRDAVRRSRRPNRKKTISNFPNFLRSKEIRRRL